MKNIIQNDEPFSIQWNDQPVEIYESITVVNSGATLKQIPDKLKKVAIDGYSEVQSPVNIGTNQYYVDYNMGVISFPSSTTSGTVLNAHYYGRGIISLSAKRVTANNTNKDVPSTIQDMIDNYNNLNGVDMYTKFDPNSGHTHSGNAGDAPPIPAANIPITDSGNIITSTNVEGALQEHGNTLKDHSQQLADLSTNINNYKNYAIKTNGVITDWKPAIDKAISENSKIIFSNDIYPISDTIYIRKDIELNGNGATLQLNKTSGSFFRADDNTLTINSVKIYGFNIDSQVKSGTVSYNFFRADSKINELSIHHNHLKYTKLKIYNQSIFRIFKNRWEHDNTVYLDSNNEPYVNISLGVKDVNMVTTANNFIGTGIFEKNYFKIYAPTSTNFDMFACSGDSSEVTVQNNHFENTNITDAVCEIDTFTMGRKFKFLNNDLINVRIMRKQMQSSNTSTIEKTDYDLWEGNTIELSADNLVMDAAAYLAGSRFKFVNNTIICKATTITVGGASSSFSAIKLAATTYLSQSEKYDEFGQYTPTRYSILGNTIDLNDAPTTSIAFENVYNNGGTLPADFDSCSDHCSIIAINTIIGGYRLVSGSPKKVCLFGNVWTNIKSNGADGRGVLLGRGSTAIGNIITDGDRQPTIQGSDILNQASTFQANTVPYSTSDPNYDSANPNDVILDASVSNVFYLSSNVRVKSIVNGYAGQIIKLIAVDGTTSLKFDGTQSQDTLYLKGLADLALTRYSSVTLTKFATNSCWIELSRSTY